MRSSLGGAQRRTCRVLSEQGCQIAARTYRSWKHPTVSARTMSDAVVIDALLATAGMPESLYGRRKMTAFLRRCGLPAVADCTVDRLMRDLGMNGVRRGRKHRATIPAKEDKRAWDLLDRDFTAEAPNLVWVADFTYCRTWSGFAYVSFIVDVYAQKIVAWHAATTKATPLVLTPLRMALWQRGSEGHPVADGQPAHHDDAGSQYTSVKLTEHLALEGIAQSIGTVGDAYDNALMEMIIGLFKAECIDSGLFRHGPFKTVEDVE